MQSLAHVHISEGFFSVSSIRTVLLMQLFLNNRFLREKGMASDPKMEYQVFLCIFQKNSAMANLGLKKMEKCLWEGRKKGERSALLAVSV